MWELLITLGAAAIGFILARNFVRRRLRFVDAIHSPFAAPIAGLGATLLALPAAFLPLVSLVTAVAFGVGTAFGTSSGARALRRLESSAKRLLP
jgi:hypothetical protein